MQIKGKGKYRGLKNNYIGRVSINESTSDILVSKKEIVGNPQLIICTENNYINLKQCANRFLLLKESVIKDFENGDILLVKPTGAYEILFKSNTHDNILFITSRCNYNCIFCPQPPKKNNDFRYFFELNKKIIDLIPQITECIGITGGEPLLAGKYLFDTLQHLNEKQPNIEIQILTNGYLLSNPEYFNKIHKCIRSNYVFEIPLYSDYSSDHDEMVGKNNAFLNTLRGIYNLAAINARIEIRTVLNKNTLERLPQFVRFIFNNLPFVEHVAFMGLEVIGNAKNNFSKIWDKNIDFNTPLTESIKFLDRWGINVSIYNIPLCALSKELRKYAAKSISLWKRNYWNKCSDCKLKNNCGGFFNTSIFKIYKNKSIDISNN